MSPKETEVWRAILDTPRDERFDARWVDLALEDYKTLRGEVLATMQTQSASRRVRKLVRGCPSVELVKFGAPGRGRGRAACSGRWSISLCGTCSPWCGFWGGRVARRSWRSS